MLPLTAEDPEPTTEPENEASAGTQSRPETTTEQNEAREDLMIESPGAPEENAGDIQTSSPGEEDGTVDMETGEVPVEAGQSAGGPDHFLSDVLCHHITSHLKSRTDHFLSDFFLYS